MRKLALFHAHQVIVKVSNTHRYHLSAEGKRISASLLTAHAGKANRFITLEILTSQDELQRTSLKPDSASVWVDVATKVIDSDASAFWLIFTWNIRHQPL